MSGWSCAATGARGFCEEADFATAPAGYLTEAVEASSVKARIKKRVAAAMKAIGQARSWS